MRFLSGSVIVILTAASLLSLLPQACDSLQKPHAFGQEKEIVVICSDSVWNAIENTLREKIEVPIHAVRWEPIFELSHLNADLLGHYNEWDKIILIESLEKAKFLPHVVDKETLKKIGGSQGLFFTNFDIWARGQRVAGLAAPLDKELLPLVRQYGDKIFKDFLHHLEVEEKIRMFDSGTDTALEDSLKSCCGFSLVLPKVYERINSDSLPPNELLYVHQDPVRSIFITWIDNPAPLDTTGKALAALRDRLLRKVYPGTVTLPERVETAPVSADSLERLRVYGVWENRKEISGGVFVSQIIESPEQNRRYIIDCLLFCPDMRRNKYRYIYQLDTILNSFKLNLG